MKSKIEWGNQPDAPPFEAGKLYYRPTDVNGPGNIVVLCCREPSKITLKPQYFFGVVVWGDAACDLAHADVFSTSGFQLWSGKITLEQ